MTLLKTNLSWSPEVTAPKAHFSRVSRVSSNWGFLEGDTSKVPKVCVSPCISYSYIRFACSFSINHTEPYHSKASTDTLKTSLVPLQSGLNHGVQATSNADYLGRNIKIFPPEMAE